MIAPAPTSRHTDKNDASARSRPLENAAASHVGLLLIFASWSFGGNIGWAQTTLTIVGGLGGIITVFDFQRRRSEQASLRPFHWLWPLAGFVALVVASMSQSNLRSSVIEGASVFLPRDVPPFLPSSARPALAFRELILFVALFLPCFNLAIVVRSRRLLCRLLWALVINAFALAVFGSLQKLIHAPGLYFGAVRSPNTRFFASFVYQNHWGAFALLHLAIGLGLLFRASRDPRYRSFFQSPAFLGLVGLLFLAASIPLSASRSCTILAAMLLGIAGFTTWRQMAEGRLSRRPAVMAVIGATLLVALTVSLAAPVMQLRIADTKEQLARLRATGSIGSRAQLYHDTWEMAHDRLLFGWGLASYPWVFPRYNRQVSVDRLPVYYEDAHSDWLQSLAETGAVGTVCRALLLALPLGALRLRGRRSTTSSYLFLGCSLVLLYAAVEFPFGNPAVVLTFWLSWFAAVRLAQLDEREESPHSSA